MFQRDIPKLPIPISRDIFVDLVFDLGRENSHGYDTIIAAVQLGDYFVSFTGSRVIYRKLVEVEKDTYNVKKTALKRFLDLRDLDYRQKGEIIDEILMERKRTFMDEPVPQVYSIELAHVVSVIAAKCNEDFSGYRTREAIFETDNCYIIKMEWEIFSIIGFRLKVCNFITVIGSIIEEILGSEKSPYLGSQFRDISREVALDPKLLAINPRTLVLGMILLGNRLKALRTYRERIFSKTITNLVQEYELKVEDVLQAFIRIKS